MQNNTDFILKVENLGHSYGKFKVIENISLGIKKGELSALIGPNGAGKTTFYNTISGKFPPKRGKVYLKGEDITGLPANIIASKGMSRSFQITNIFSGLSVEENIYIPLILKYKKGFHLVGNIFKDKAIKEKVSQKMELVGITKFAKKKVSDLAYGDRRLVEIAIVLAIDPEVVLLDEPTAGMNPEETDKMISLIKRLSDITKTTFFITEHDMKVVFSLAEIIYVLHQGFLLAKGTPQEIRDNEEVKEAYLGRKVNVKSR